MWFGIETTFSGSLGILECGNWSNMKVGGWVQNWICLGYVFLSFVTFSDIFFLCTFPPTQGRLGYICLGGRVDSQLSCTIYTKLRGPWRKCWLVMKYYILGNGHHIFLACSLSLDGNLSDILNTLKHELFHFDGHSSNDGFYIIFSVRVVWADVGQNITQTFNTKRPDLVGG